MKKMLLLNCVVLLFSVLALFVTLELMPDIASKTTLLEQMHNVESASATAERRQESVRNLLISTESRFDRAAIVSKTCLTLCVLSTFASILNFIYLKRQGKIVSNPKAND